MNRTYLIAGPVVVLVVAVGLGAALYTGVGPVLGGDSGDEIEDFPTEDDADTDGSDTTSSDESESLTFSIDEIEECGETCRNVTSTLDNNHPHDRRIGRHDGHVPKQRTGGIIPMNEHLSQQTRSILYSPGDGER